MLNIEDAVDLRHVPAQATSEFGLADALLPHALVKQHLDRGECRQGGVGLPPGRSGNVVTAVDAGGDRLLKRVHGAGGRFLAVVAERGQFGEVGGCHQDGAVVIFEHDRVGEHQFNPRSFLILATSPLPSSLRPPCIGQLTGAVAPPDGDVSAATLVGLEGATLFP